MARVLTWPVHGNYLLYLPHAPHEFVVPVRSDRPYAYGGLGSGFPWPDNLVEVEADDVPTLDLDAVLYQAASHYLADRHTLLSSEQRSLPAVSTSSTTRRASIRPTSGTSWTTRRRCSST